MNKPAFRDYVLVASGDSTLQGKFDLAVVMGFVDAESDLWILDDEEQVYGLCDFITPGGFPAFMKREDAVTCNEILVERQQYSIQERQREGVKYFFLD